MGRYGMEMEKRASLERCRVECGVERGRDITGALPSSLPCFPLDFLPPHPLPSVRPRRSGHIDRDYRG
ncbi:hypothetical protein E2C01_089649 [Portunus trituberculatus]|uniref:Uncharacterized protein n=1 Tax=Portunus trituberculatus TaxID=210409 RepID=A0A5B7JMZ9_PORTR|nr:hypothetical protein [Portunus trituberculatus]